MRSRALVLAALLTAVAGCGVLPWADYGPAPDLCAGVFDPAARIEWAGRGHTVELGLVPADEPPDAPNGDIYVGRAGEHPVWARGQRVWCLIGEGALHDVTVGVVPEGWQPP